MGFVRGGGVGRIHVTVYSLHLTLLRVQDLCMLALSRAAAVLLFLRYLYCGVLGTHL